jgi:glycosyltransferase involved in cell wall biosynthesis
VLSVVIPLLNEEESLPRLHEELRLALEALDTPFEIIYVDDGSTDGSFAYLRRVAEQDHDVVVVQFRRNFGQTAALAAGIELARGGTLVFLDADLQNPPSEIPKLLNKLNEGYDVVSGWRKKRQDSRIRTFPSHLANWVISRVSGVYLNDYGCTLKAYRAEVLDNVRLYGEMHRFIPAYAAWAGARITELPVEHRARVAGKSKYGLNRTIKVLLDLLTLKFLSTFSTKPIYLFGGLGAACIGSSGATSALVLYQRFFHNVRAHRNPILLISLFQGLTGLLLVTQGLLAELIARTYYESQGKTPYVIRNVVRSGKLEPRRAPRNGAVSRLAPTSSIASE